MIKYSRYIVLGLSFLVAAFLIYVFRAIVSYILIAWVLSMIGQPIVVFLKSKVKIGKFRMGPNLSAIITLLLYFVVFIIFIFIDYRFSCCFLFIFKIIRKHWLFSIYK